jgi:hypothetical protein
VFFARPAAFSISFKLDRHTPAGIAAFSVRCNRADTNGKGITKVILAKQTQFSLKLKKQRHLHPCAYQFSEERNRGVAGLFVGPGNPACNRLSGGVNASLPLR